MPVGQLSKQLSKKATQAVKKLTRENRKRLKDHEDFKDYPETLEEYLKEFEGEELFVFEQGHYGPERELSDIPLSYSSERLTRRLLIDYGYEDIEGISSRELRDNRNQGSYFEDLGNNKFKIYFNPFGNKRVTRTITKPTLNDLREQTWFDAVPDDLENVYYEKLGKKLENKRTKKNIGGQMRKLYNKGTQVMTQEERKQSKRNDLRMSVRVQIDREDNEYPQKEIDRAYKALVKNSKTVGFSQGDVDFELQAERERRADERREAAIEANPLLEKRQIRNEGGAMDDQMSMLMGAEETHTMPDGTVMPGATHEEYEQMLPDEEMEEDYVEYVFDSTLNPQDKEYLENALAEDAKLSEIIDIVVESTTEFSGSGPIEGPGNEKSDSIPARLSDGEFVITAKATEEIGADNLMSMMKDAEAAADERQSVAYGGMIDEEDQAVPLPTQGSRAAQGNVPSVVKQSRQVEEEMLKSSPRRYYVPVSG